MSSARLRPADVAEQVRQVKRQYDAGLPVALFGEGEPGAVTVDGERWRVVPVGSELALRGALVDGDGGPMVLLVDFSERPPLDVAARLAGNRVFALERRARLARLFGARKVAPELMGTALADVLLELLPDGLDPIRGTVLRTGDAWQRVLALRAQGWPKERPADLDALVTLAATRPDDGVALRRAPGARWPAALEEAAAWLKSTQGVVAALFFKAWLEGTGEALLGWAVLVDAALRADHAGATAALRITLRHAPGVDPSLLDPEVAPLLAEAAGRALRAMDERGRGRVLARAAGLCPDPEFGPARRASPWLPDGLAALEDDLAAALAAAAAGGDALDRVISVVERMEQHHLVLGSELGRRRQAVRQAGAQLATWLLWLERQPVPDGEGMSALPRLAQWHAEHGAWVDRARAELREHSTGHAGVDAALRGLLGAVDRVRRQADRRFAEALVAWTEGAGPGRDVVHVEDVAKRVVAPFLRENPARRLLIVLMDGMPASVALGIVDRLEGWGPVAWTPQRMAAMPPALAALPTLTATSRAALFAGRAAPAHGDEEERLDTLRFAANPSLREYASDAGPRLFLKASLQRDGALDPGLLAALGAAEERVVAVVVNAIDEDLHGSDQVAVDYGQPGAIPLLDRLLVAARDAGRAALLTADHGHVPAAAMTGQPRPEGSREGGARWRTLGPGQAPLDGEVRLPDGCWRPRGHRDAALLWDERRCWGSARTGAHGGASLAEVVVPLWLLAPTGLWRATGDEGLRVVDLHRPAWWRRLRPQVKAAKTGDERQLSLLAAPRPARTPPATVTAAPTAERRALTRALAASAGFRAQSQGQPPERVAAALDYVDALCEAPGHLLPVATFAGRVGVPSRRVAGLVAHVGFLNADGFTILELDPVAQQVRLHRDRLVSQYGLRENVDD